MLDRAAAVIRDRLTTSTVSISEAVEMIRPELVNEPIRVLEHTAAGMITGIRAMLS